MTPSARHALLLPALLLILTGSLSAQIAIDVKTPWLEKHRLRGLKGGIAAAIDAAPWGRTTEFGEDYVVLLRDLKRSRGGADTVVLSVTVDLRSASILGRGDELSSRSIEIRYCGKVLDSLAVEIDGQGGGLVDPAYGPLVDRLIATGVNMLPISNPFVKVLLTAAITTLNEGPAATEIAEGAILATRVVDEIDEMISAR